MSGENEGQRSLTRLDHDITALPTIFQPMPTSAFSNGQFRHNEVQSLIRNIKVIQGRFKGLVQVRLTLYSVSKPVREVLSLLALSKGIT